MNSLIRLPDFVPVSGYPLRTSAAVGAGVTSFIALMAPQIAIADADVSHYDLELAIDPATVYFDATAEVDVSAKEGEGSVTQLALDFVGFNIKDVSWNGAAANWSRAGDQLSINLPAPLAEGTSGVLSVRYDGIPLPYPTETGNLGVMQGNGITFAINVTEGAHYWFPCRDRLDDKATADLALILPAGYQSAGPGHLVGVATLDDGRERHQWSMTQEVTPYLLSFAFSDQYAREHYALELASGPLEADVALLAEQWPDAWNDLEPLPDMLNWLEGRYGRFPYDQVGFHEIPYPGAVEQPGNIAMGSFYWTGDASLQVYFAHELSHTWFQGLVTIRTWNDIFMDESIAAWHELAWTEQAFGIEEADYYAYVYLLAYIVGIADEGVFSLSDPRVLFGYTTYMKGAVVWRLLEHLLGREQLITLLDTYLEDTDGIAGLDEFFALVDANATPDVSMFRDEWIDRAGLPTYRFGWRKDSSGTGYGLALRLTQSTDNVYTTPIDVRIDYADGSQETVTVRPDSADYSVSMCLEREPAEVVLDPRFFVPRFTDGETSVTASASDACGGSTGCSFAGKGPRAGLAPLAAISLSALAIRRRRCG